MEATSTAVYLKKIQLKKAVCKSCKDSGVWNYSESTQWIKSESAAVYKQSYEDSCVWMLQGKIAVCEIYKNSRVWNLKDLQV